MTHRILVFVALAGLLLATAAPAHARRGPNPDGRTAFPPLQGLAPTVATSEARPAQPDEQPARAQAAQAVGVPLPVGAIQLDSTYYDLQDIASLATRVAVGADGRVHVTWQDDNCPVSPTGCPPNLSAPVPFPVRGMSYAVRDAAGVWNNRGRVGDPRIRCSACVPDLMGGLGGLALAPTNRIAIAEHMNEDGCDLRSVFYYLDTPTGTTFSGDLTPIESPSYLFGQVAALPNGSFVVSGERLNTTNPPASYLEVAEVRVSRFTSAGIPFVCPTGWQGGVWTAFVPPGTFPDGSSGYPSLAAGSDGRAGVAMTDFGKNVWLFESSDGTFNPGTVTTRKLTSYSDATIVKPDSTSTEWRPYINCHLAYRDTTPNVVWSELQARTSGSQIFFADFHSRIMHWSSTRGVTLVKQGGPETGSYDNVDNGQAGPVVGLNHISNDWPQVGFSTDGGETYVAWVRCVDSQVDPTANAGIPGATGIGFGDIEASVALGNGPWSAAQNLTQTPQTDERYVAIAPRNAGGNVGILFQASATNQAGIAEAQDRGTTPSLYVRRIAWLERHLTASVVSVDGPAAARGDRAMLVAQPNPARGAVRFAASTAGASGAVLVFTVDGRRVARLMLERGRAAWNGRDAGGRMVPSGVYLARLEGERSAAARFMWLN
jgi:hypothetical protein